MPIEGVIRRIIDHHNQFPGDSNHKYWHTKLEHIEGEKAKNIINQLDHSNHHIGDFYLHNGMRINLEKESPQALELLKVMNFIAVSLIGDGGAENMIKVGKKLFLKQESKKDFEDELLQYKQIYRDVKKNRRSLIEIDLPEEVVIKTIAVSILAETNGNAKMATDLISSGGIETIKKMNVTELQHLIGELKSLSTQTSDNVR